MQQYIWILKKIRDFCQEELIGLKRLQAACLVWLQMFVLYVLSINVPVSSYSYDMRMLAPSTHMWFYVFVYNTATAASRPSYALIKFIRKSSHFY